MKVYYAEVYVGNYDISAIGSTAENCVKAIVKEYKKRFGSFRENGFKNQADWLEYHGLSASSCWEVELDKAWTK